MYDRETRARALTLVADGTSANAVSKQLGISRAAIRSWLLDPAGPMGGARPCPAPAAPGPDYAALFGFYLGDGHISEYPRYSAMRITCDAKYGAIITDVARLLESINPARRTFLVKAPGCVVVKSNWKHWPCLFPQHGPGRKHERALVMAPWQQEIVDAYPAEFLRGLFHSDGSLVKNWATRMVAGEPKRYDYPRWQFVNESRDIMRWCGLALDGVGIRWRQTKPRVLSVSRRDDVARLTALIGEKS